MEYKYILKSEKNRREKNKKIIRKQNRMRKLMSKGESEKTGGTKPPCDIIAQKRSTALPLTLLSYFHCFHIEDIYF